MEYRLTQHATDALTKRQISREWLERILNSPEWTEKDAMDPDLEHRLGRITDFEGRVLRVILNVQVTPPKVVTVYFDRRKTVR